MKTLSILFFTLLSFNQLNAQQNEEDKQPVTLEINKTGITCFGSNDATVTITIFGGYAPYAVNGNPISGNVFSISGLSAGNYEYFISDIYMSNATEYVTFDEADPIAIISEVVNATNNLASDGSITIMGAGDYSFEWSGPAGVDIDTYSKDQTNLAPGDYNVIITSNSGCSVEYNYNVGSNNVLGDYFTSFNPSSIENDFAGAEPQMIMFFPNPARERVTIKELSTGEQMRIFNANGILIKEVNSNQSMQTIDLTPGVYRVMKTNSDGSITQEQLIMQ